MWFPKPDTPADLLVKESSGGFSAVDLLALLHSNRAEEWRERVGVVGAADGSAKSSTRLLLADGNVLKTNTQLLRPSEEEAWGCVAQAMELAARASLWHPSKQWFVIRTADGFYPASISQRLATLRQRDTFAEKSAGWAAMLDLGLRISSEHGVGVDLNPSNFGVAAGDSTLWYLDDELYAAMGVRELGEAMVGRIPEEAKVPADTWRAWGESLHEFLRYACRTAADWEALFSGIGDYPLTSLHDDRRAALLAAVRLAHPAEQKRAQRKQIVTPSATPQMTCVMGDVHANLTALEAVLARAREMGADSYIILGDVVGYGPHPKECIARLRELPNATFVRGNHDNAIGSGDLGFGMNRMATECAHWTREVLSPEELAWLTELPVDHRDGGILSVHGAPRDPNKFFAYVYELTYQDNLTYMHDHNIQLCFYGHTHIPYVHRRGVDGVENKLGAMDTTLLSAGDIYLVNPGSVGQPRDGDYRAGFAMWDRKSNRLKFCREDYDVSQVTSALKKFDLPFRLIERLETGR